MNEHDVFIADERPAPVVRAVIEAALGAAFTSGQGPEPATFLATGTTTVFFHDSHSFEDDTDFPVTRYRYWCQRSRHDQEHLTPVRHRTTRLRRRHGRRMASDGLLRHLGPPRHLPVTPCQAAATACRGETKRRRCHTAPARVEAPRPPFASVGSTPCQRLAVR
jgi:hypothetical protein